MRIGIDMDDTICSTNELIIVQADKYDKEVLGELNVYDDLYKQPSRKKCATLSTFGIEKILYKCPDCDSEYNLYTEDDKIICKHCGLKIKVNEYYDLEGINNTSPSLSFRFLVTVAFNT